MRGPLTQPALMASRNATSPPNPEFPTSRTVVMPASRSSRPIFTPSSARFAVLIVATVISMFGSSPPSSPR